MRCEGTLREVGIGEMFGRHRLSLYLLVHSKQETAVMGNTVQEAIHTPA
jgi:hypothetical protein